MVKMDTAAVVKMLGGLGSNRRYIVPMPTFTLDGVTYEYLQPAKPQRLHLIKSWEYPHWPRVEAAVHLSDGGTVKVYGEASRWSAEPVHVRRADDEGHLHAAWLPTSSVRPLTAFGVGHRRVPPDAREPPPDPLGKQAAGVPSRVANPMGKLWAKQSPVSRLGTTEHDLAGKG
jgi:hypothetical protein